MSEPFAPDGSGVVVDVFVIGPRRQAKLQFAVDTGSNRTLVRPTVLSRLGCDLSAPIGRGRIRSTTGGATAGVYSLPRLESLGHERTDFPVVAYEMPPVVTYDGLLGLDFFRGLVLTLDFARGRASLGPPRRWWQLWR